MEENNINDQQLNKNNNLAPNSLDAQNKTSKQNSGPFHNEKLPNDVIMKNRLNMIRNNLDHLRANAHLFDKVNQRKNMPQENRNGRKNRENDQASATESMEDNTTEKKSLKDQLLGRNKDNQEDSEGEGSKAVDSLFNKDKKEEDPTDKAVKGSLKLTLSAAMMPIMIGIVTIFFILLLVLSVPMMVVAAFSPIFAVADKLGFDTGGEEYSSDDKEEADFTERLSDVMEDYDEVDQETVAKVVSGVFAVVNSYNEDFGYDDMSKGRMKDVSDMLIDNDYDAEKFKQKLASDFLPKHIKGLNDEKYLAIAEEVYEYIEGYQSIIGDETSNVAPGTINQCSYDLSSVNYEYGSIRNPGISPSNIKVRLMQASSCGGTYDTPIAGEELVDFEKYVLGVAYAEIGDEASEEAFKAQLVVARSFALVISSINRKRGSSSLKQENGQWIMEIANCNADQYYCDPDKGCSWDGTSGNRHAISGTNGPELYKNPLPANAPQRNWAVEVMGKVAVDASGNVFWPDFVDGTQTQMKSLADQGMDYTSILVNLYKDKGFSSILDGNCQNVSTGIYSTWKQNNPLWANIVLGGGTDMNKSLGNIGCLVTSIAILIQKSGVLMMEPTPTFVSSDTFTPGTFASALNQVGAFNSMGELSNYTKVTTVVPKFSWHSSQNLSGMSKADKLAVIKEKANLGLYCVVQVLDGSTNGTHFVALDYVDSNDNIKMIDPGAADYGTDMWQGYDWKQTAKINCYEVK